MHNWFDTTLDFAKMVLLVFFVLMDGIALIQLFPKTNSRDPAIVFIAAVILSLLLIGEFVRTIASRRKTKRTA